MTKTDRLFRDLGQLYDLYKEISKTRITRSEYPSRFETATPSQYVAEEAPDRTDHQKNETHKH